VLIAYGVAAQIQAVTGSLMIGFDLKVRAGRR
jgi:hypothetical protein